MKCPAGGALIEPPGDGPSVVCGAIERENRLSPSVHGASDFRRSQVRALVTFREEPATILGYCCSERGYQNCPVWRADCARREKRGLKISAGDVNYGGVGNRF